MTISFFDLFAGIGGFRLGLENLGWKCVGYCEIDKYAAQTYRANFQTKGEFFWADAQTLDAQALPAFDVLCAGFPCQAWSVAGKRKGFEDARGTLVYEIFRVLDARKPRAFLLENVEGLTFQREAFWRILETLRSLGYAVFHKVLNSKDYGVPQNRERVFFAGFKRTGSGLLANDFFRFPESKPLRTKLKDLLETDVPEKYLLSDRLKQTLVKHLLRHRAMGHGFGMRVLDPFCDDAVSLSTGGQGRERNLLPVANTIRARYYKDGSENLLLVDARSVLHQSRGLEARSDEVSHAIKGGEGGSSRVHVMETRNLNPSGRGLSGRVASDEDIVPALLSSEKRWAGSWQWLEQADHVVEDTIAIAFTSSLDQDGYLRSTKRARNEAGQAILVPISYKRIRRLTPRECARLQGFPESFVIRVSDTQAYRQFGNAVTVPVVEAIGREMAKWLTQ